MLDGNHTFTPAGCIQKPDLRQICRWVLESWNAISPDTIKHSFLKCCITNALDGTEDDVLWEETDESDLFADNPQFRYITLMYQNHIYLNYTFLPKCTSVNPWLNVYPLEHISVVRHLLNIARCHQQQWPVHPWNTKENLALITSPFVTTDNRLVNTLNPNQ